MFQNRSLHLLPWYLSVPTLALLGMSIYQNDIHAIQMYASARFIHYHLDPNWTHVLACVACVAVYSRETLPYVSQLGLLAKPFIVGIAAVLGVPFITAVPVCLARMCIALKPSKTPADKKAPKVSTRLNLSVICILLVCALRLSAGTTLHSVAGPVCVALLHSIHLSLFDRYFGCVTCIIMTHSVSTLAHPFIHWFHHFGIMMACYHPVAMMVRRFIEYRGVNLDGFQVLLV